MFNYLVQHERPQPKDWLEQLLRFHCDVSKTTKYEISKTQPRTKGHIGGTPSSRAFQSSHGRRMRSSSDDRMERTRPSYRQKRSRQRGLPSWYSTTESGPERKGETPSDQVDSGTPRRNQTLDGGRALEPWTDRCLLEDAWMAGVSTERIDRWLWTMKRSHKAIDAPYKRWYLYWRHAKRRRQRGNDQGNRGGIPDRQSMDQRPAIVEERVRFGDFEADLMIGSKTGCPLFVLTDRASRYTKIQKLPSKGATPVVQAVIENIREIGPQLMKTIPFDHGLELAKHHLIKQQFGIETYFTRPYSSQEKGTVENRIGILRR